VIPLNAGLLSEPGVLISLDKISIFEYVLASDVRQFNPWRIAMKQKKSGSPVRGLPDRVTNEHLKKHAVALTRIFYLLRKTHTDLTTDKLWLMARRFWSTEELETAVANSRKKIGAFHRLLSIPRAPKEVFRFRKAEVGTVNALSRSVGLTKKIVSKQIENHALSFIWGLDCYNRPVKLYALSDVRRAVGVKKSLNELPKTNQKGFCVIRGRKYMTLLWISEALHLDRSTIAKACLKKRVKRIRGRGLRNKREWLYDLSETKKALRGLLRLEHNNATGLEKFKADGDEWAVFSVLTQLIPIKCTGSSLRRRLRIRKVSFRWKRFHDGQPVRYYSVKGTRAAWEDLLREGLRADRSGIIREGDYEWLSLTAIGKRVGLTHQHVRNVILKSGRFRRIKGFDHLNRPNQVYYSWPDAQRVFATYIERNDTSNDPVTSVHLKVHASVLSRALYALRKRSPKITSDQLWKKIQKHWTAKRLAKEVTAFRKTKRVTRFQTLLAA
jgi:hypothetical protein